MTKKKIYTTVSISSVILSGICWLFLRALGISYTMRTVFLRNVNFDNGLDLNTSESIERALHNWLQNSHPIYLYFESGRLNNLPQVLIILLLITAIIFAVKAYKSA